MNIELGLSVALVASWLWFAVRAELYKNKIFDLRMKNARLIGKLKARERFGGDE